MNQSPSPNTMSWKRFFTCCCCARRKSTSPPPPPQAQAVAPAPDQVIQMQPIKEDPEPIHAEPVRPEQVQIETPMSTQQEHQEQPEQPEPLDQQALLV